MHTLGLHTRVHTGAPPVCKMVCTPVCKRKMHTTAKNEKSPKSPYFKGHSGICTLMRTSHDRSCCGEHIVHIDGVVGSSPTVTTKAEAVENQRLLLFYPLRGTRPQRYTPSMWTACSPNKATRSGWLRCRNRVGFIARIRVGLNAVVDVNGMSVPGQA